MFRALFVLALMGIGSAPAASADMAPIKDREIFVEYMDGRTLTIRLYGLRLDVTADGEINGKALGREVLGTWSWEDGYFCREMVWGTRPIEYNCQLVEASGNTMRFTTDRGDGNYADFRLR